MKIVQEKIDDKFFILVDGRIDTTNYNEFEKAANEIVSAGYKKLYLDCSKLNYISSSGLRVFLTVQKRMTAENGQFKLYSLQAGIREIFDISGFSKIFSIYPDREAALLV